MKKVSIVHITILAILLSLSPAAAPNLMAADTASGVKELKLEDAIEQAQRRSRQLRLQQTKIDYAKVDSEEAYYDYRNGDDYSFEIATTNYSQKKLNEEYETKLEPVIKEQIAFDIETQFDSILELEEKYNLSLNALKVQEQKTNHAIKKLELGLGSESVAKAEKANLEMQKKELEVLKQSIDGGYRKLNDTIGGKETRYNLIKETIYTPLNMNRSLQGHISHSISTDLTLWLQEESAKLQEGIIVANTINGAPTYTEYQKRKLSYAEGMSSASISKENREKLLKDRYDQIIQLEKQYEKELLNLEEARRKYEIVKKQYELEMTTSLALDEAKVGVMQLEVQINSIIRQHNKLKQLFQKSYLG